MGDNLPLVIADASIDELATIVRAEIEQARGAMRNLDSCCYRIAPDRAGECR
jgi:hypothetical protein